MSRLPRVRVVIAFRTVRHSLARFMTGSFAVHGLLLATVLVIPATRRKTAPIEDTMVVALAGPISAAPAARSGPPATPQVKAQSAPPPAPAPKEAHTVREVPLPKPKPKADKPKKEPVKPAETPSTSTNANASPQPAHGAAGGTPGAAKPAAGSGAITATLGAGDSSLGWYGAAVKAALEAAWVKPYLEDAQGMASVIVAFDIARDGTTRNFRVVQSSGIPSLDRSAQRAVIEASPLPGVPPTWTEDTIPVTMRFDLSPETN